jgi:ATP-binding cassette, subfamily B, bacterial
LARALLRNPPILILDEARSSLDPIAESAVRSTLDRLRDGRTILSVTHRLNAVMNADRILVLDQGRRCQQGTHDELIGREGLYRNLWTKQNGFVLDSATHHAEISIDRLRLVPVFYGMPDNLLSEAVRLFQTEEFPEDHLVIYAKAKSAQAYTSSFVEAWN